MKEEFPLTFEFLRSKGIDSLQLLSGNNWTDYNLHDPGVTILEQLCFALTDLSYRTSFDIKDILADKKGHINQKENSFINAREVLCTNPVTINDIRKHLIDTMPGIFNAWVEPIISQNTNHHLKGLYRVIIQAEDEETNPVSALAVQQCLGKIRNICFDFEEFTFLRKKEVTFSANIEITEPWRADEIMADICYEIESFLNYNINYHTEKQLLSKGQTIEQIYDGPMLQNGIIPDTEMTDRTIEVDPLQLANVIVKNVQGVTMVKYPAVSFNGTYYQYALKIEPQYHAYFNYTSPANKIILFANGLPLQINDIRFTHLLLKKREQHSKRKYTLGAHKIEQSNQITGNYRNLEKYYSIQNYFPEIYGIGPDGQAKTEKTENKARAKQLKAYLILFEQVLANYLSQLSNVSNIFSPSPLTEKTYCFQPLHSVPGASAIIKTSIDKDDVSNKQISHDEYILSLLETDPEFHKRKNDFLNHIMSRFNFAPSDFPVLLYNQTYKQKNNSNRLSTLIKWKAGMLENLNQIIANRVTANNYMAPHSNNIINYQKNIYTFLHILNDTGKKLASSTNTPKVGITSIKGSTEANKHKINSTTIPQQPISFLKTALNKAKYFIDKEENGYSLKFENEASEKISIGFYNSLEDAKKALNNTVEALTELSIKSEGFHLVEHLLLRPGLASKSFGFQVYTHDNQLKETQEEWLTFAMREQIVKGLLERFKRDYGNYYIKHTIKIRQHEFIDEEFYSFRMSFVFPAWPARFQDASFREFTKTLIRTYTPAYIHTRIYWLGIKSMQKFEALYFQWFSSLQHKTHTDYCETAGELIAFLTYEKKGI